MGAKNTSKYTGYFKPGRKFGKYTIITGDIVKGNNNNESKVECLCECGKINIVSTLLDITRDTFDLSESTMEKGEEIVNGICSRYTN